MVCDELSNRAWINQESRRVQICVPGISIYITCPSIYSMVCVMQSDRPIYISYIACGYWLTMMAGVRGMGSICNVCSTNSTCDLHSIVIKWLAIGVSRPLSSYQDGHLDYL